LYYKHLSNIMQSSAAEALSIWEHLIPVHLRQGWIGQLGDVILTGGGIIDLANEDIA